MVSYIPELEMIDRRRLRNVDASGSPMATVCITGRQFTIHAFVVLVECDLLHGYMYGWKYMTLKNVNTLGDRASVRQTAGRTAKECIAFF